MNKRKIYIFLGLMFLAITLFLVFQTANEIPSEVPSIEAIDTDRNTQFISQDKVEDEDEEKVEPIELDSLQISQEENQEVSDSIIEDKEPMIKDKEAINDYKEEDVTVQLSVSCTTIFDNLDKFNEEKIHILPEDGLIYPLQEVELVEGESVFDLLLREMKDNKIHFEHSSTPIYKASYIEGIGNIYEFDCGPLSGWIYKVNGVSPSYGSNQYKLEDGDFVEWLYTCDLGRDVGAEGMNTGSEAP